MTEFLDVKENEHDFAFHLSPLFGVGEFGLFYWEDCCFVMVFPKHLLITAWVHVTLFSRFAQNLIHTWCPVVGSIAKLHQTRHHHLPLHCTTTAAVQMATPVPEIMDQSCLITTDYHSQEGNVNLHHCENLESYI
jgi:hypothetical protein